MTSYYNEWDEKTACWLRALIAAGLIPPGDVDTRSITEVLPDDLKGYTQCHFFAGIGGWALALQYAGWPADRPVWTGSCPCQPFSLAGAQKGFADTRHLWPEFLRLIGIGRPATLFGEQVASATAWLGLVRGDLEALGYAVGAMPIEAASAGADHLRDRFWFVGDYQGDGRRERRPKHGVLVGEWPAFASTGGPIDMGNTEHGGREGRQPERQGAGAALPSGEAGVANTDQFGASEERQQRGGEQRWSGGDQEACDWVIGADGKARRVKPGVRLLVNGFPCRVGLLRGFGNAIDPRPAAEFIQAADEAIRGCA